MPILQLRGDPFASLSLKSHRKPQYDISHRMQLTKEPQSATKITTGSYEQDLLHLVVGHTNIGKSILNLPTSLEHFDKLHRKYKAKIGVAEQDELEATFMKYL